MKLSGTKVNIATSGIFSFKECLRFLDRGYDDCLYSIEGNRIIKPLLIDGHKTLLQIKEGNHSLEVAFLNTEATEPGLEQAEAFIVEWFDLDRELQPFYQLLSEHSLLPFMSREFFGLRLMGIPDLFEALCWCIIGQQINLAFAHRLKRKLVENYGTSINYYSRPYYFFPEPELLAGLNVRDLKALQFSRQKAEYVIGIAKEFAEGSLSKASLRNRVNRSQMLKRLIEIRGVGEWTANYVLMKSLKRMDCIPYGDSGLNNALSSILGLDKKPTRTEVETFFEPFAGWESYLVIYLWRTLSSSR